MKFTSINGYMSSTMWLTATVLQLFTQRFCKSYWNKSNDPSGGMFDQMTRAARSVAANIAEGLGRHQTSRETELKLLDVARASLSELYNDFYFIMLEQQWSLWPRRSQPTQAFDAIKIDPPVYISDDWPTESMRYIRKQLEKFSSWCSSGKNDVDANSLMMLIDRLQMIIETKMNSLLESFREEGGFREALTRERLERRNGQAEETETPKCPLCGKPMFRRLTKAGARQGTEFWGCSAFPQCRGTRPIK